MTTKKIAVGLLSALALLLSSCDGGAKRPDVLLVIVDTVRADHLSTYGYLRKTTPNLDALAAEGERYDNAWSQSSWTLPSIASILTGQPPHVHGAGRGERGMFGLRDEVATLAERLTDAGYRAAAFINVIWCNPGLSSLDRGFERYDFAATDESNRNQRSAGDTTDAALGWLDAASDDPFFMVVHYFDPHLTYDPPAPYDTMFEPDEGPRIPPGFGSATEVFQVRDGSLALDERRRKSLIARYDGELRYTDEEFGRLRAGLEAAGRWDDTLVIVVGDHGEEFWDHGGFEHGHSHHREMLRVPLIVCRPGGPQGVARDGLARQLDIAPTVLDAAGLPVAAELPGQVLGETGARYAVAEGTLWAGDIVSIRSDEGTQLLNRSYNQSMFFAADDPLERTPLPPNDSLLQLLRALPGPRRSEDRPRELTEEQIEQLRSLGYLQ